MTSMRAALLSAVAAGFGLAGCRPDPVATASPDPTTPARPSALQVPVGPVPAPPASPTAAASPAASTRADRCRPDGVTPERYCIPVGESPASGEKSDPSREHTRRNGLTTCLDRDALYKASSCQGLRPLDGPDRSGSTCCYTICREPQPCGRPLVVAGKARVARAAARSPWGPALGELAWRASSEDVALADAWLADALAEHASVASFARVSLELLALGAPPELISATQRASLDEIEHARACIALVAHFAPERSGCGPGRLDLAGLALDVDPISFAERLGREGCVGETFAALALARASALCADPAIAGVVERMGREEADHAALAFRTAAWLVATFGVEVERALVRGASLGLASAWDAASISVEAARRGGRLTRDELVSVLDEAAREVVGPALASLANA